MTIALSRPRAYLLTFTSPEDRAEFCSYPKEEQEAVRALHDAMMRIDKAPNPHQGCKAAALPRAGWTASRLRSIYDDEWLPSGKDWRALIDGRKFPESRAKLPQDFRDWIKAKFSANQRKNAPAYRQMIRQWEKWLRTSDPALAIPGYESCPPPGRRARHPDGWSLKNLNRYAPPAAELAMARIGTHAAREILPQIPGTREGCRFLEWISGDDVWLDRQAMVPGFGPCRVVQFGLMDFGASYYLKFIQRPILPRKDGTDEQLKRRDFLWLIGMFLEETGFPLDYAMHILCERGTATMSKAEAQYLYEVSEGKIIVGYSSMEGQLVHAWNEKRSGDSRAKGWHESFHNLFHNECGDLPGQVGMDRHHTPAALQGRERHALALENAAMMLSPQERARLKFPFANVRDCYEDTLTRVEWINSRPQHDCEGFATVMEWRPKGLAILPQSEAALVAWLQANPRADINQDVEWFPRPESPKERAIRLAQGVRFQRLPSAIWRTFYEDLHETRRIAADGSFEFERDKRKYRFVPPTPDEALQPGMEVTGFFRPDGSAIHLFAGKQDRYLLTWPAETKVRRGGELTAAQAEEKQAAFSRKQTFFNVALANVRKATSEEVEAAQADVLNNAQVLVENGVLEASTLGGLGDLAGEAITPAAAAVQAAVKERAADTARRTKPVDLIKETLRSAEIQPVAEPFY